MKVIRYLAAVSWFSVAAAQELPAIGIIDFYGLHTVKEADVRAVLPFKEGDAAVKASGRNESAVAAKLGVYNVATAFLCCTEKGEGIVFVGVEEVPMLKPAYHQPPTGDAALPAPIVETSQALMTAFFAAVRRGDAEEDTSQGHSLAKAPEVRRLQEKLVGFAAEHWQSLIHVLRTSADDAQRAVAAEVIAYAKDKAMAVPHLEWAALDPDEGVRNNATRALALIAQYAASNPSLGIKIEPAPFIDMLNSPHFLDRNKGSYLVVTLTEARNPELLGAIKKKALFSLIEMCHWKSASHALASCLILSRVLGMPEPAAPFDAEARKAMTLAALPFLPRKLRAAAQRFVGS